MEKICSVVVVAAASRGVVADWRAEGFLFFLWLWRLSSSRRTGFRGRTGVVLEGEGGHGQRAVFVV